MLTGTKAPNKEVAFKPYTIATENLPFPIVLYPRHYGAFFAFKEHEQSNPFFCSCAYEAIENYIKLRLLSSVPQNSDPTRMFILDSFYFPKSVIEDLMRKNLTHKNILSALNFAEKLCHECNLQIPSYRYCHEMYGEAFKQNYGWYINKQAFEWGIDPLNRLQQFLPESCPDELLAILKNPEFEKIILELQNVNEKLFEVSKVYYSNEYKDLKQVGKEKWSGNWLTLKNEQETLSKQFRKYHRKIWHIIENEVRRKFGHKKIGEAWTSETILYYIVKKLFPNYIIHRHYKPDFLKGLELDIYIEEANIGIEYQGIQHYKPIKHWGGKEALGELKKRDEQKRKLCETQKVKLVYFDYSEGLSDDFVLAKLKLLMKL